MKEIRNLVEESNHYLATLFSTTALTINYPIPTHWTTDYDHRSVRRALPFACRTSTFVRRPKMGVCCYRVADHFRDSIEQHGAGPSVDTSQVEPGSDEHWTGTGASSIQDR
jgi:hypothetical protein